MNQNQKQKFGHHTIIILKVLTNCSEPKAGIIRETRNERTATHRNTCKEIWIRYYCIPIDKWKLTACPSSAIQKTIIFSPDQWNVVPDVGLKTRVISRVFLDIISQCNFCPDRNSRFPKISPDGNCGWVRQFFELRIGFQIIISGWLR